MEIGKIAASPAGDQDFGAHLVSMLEQQDFPVSLAGSQSGAEPGRQSILSYHADPGRSGNFIIPSLTWERAISLHLEAIWFMRGLRVTSSASLGTVGLNWTIQTLNAG